MALHWTEAFCQGEFPWKTGDGLSDAISPRSLDQRKNFLDQAHIKNCLLRPWCESPDYPVVEPRDLLPSFEPDAYEYDHLPGFSMVAFARPLQPFQEIFQYDALYPPQDAGLTEGEPQNAIAHNAQTFLARLPRPIHDDFRREFDGVDAASLNSYPALLPYIARMDRAHVLARDASGSFRLSGIYASFPSDADGEIKRFGLRAGKFRLGDNDLYERNRQFVCQYLMELYGFPIASERRTSAVMFARKLQQLGEQFLVRVLGQSDRVITTIWLESSFSSPQIEKIALIRIDEDQSDLLRQLEEEGYLADPAQRVAIARIIYRQHRFSPDNVRQDRALSVKAQELIHPLTGKVLTGVNIIHDSTTLILRLNDIARGEFSGRVIYKRNEIVENTDTHEKRLKCLFAWLSRHQRRIISYSDEFYGNVTKVLDGYLFNPQYSADFEPLYELLQEVLTKYAYIRQARHVRDFEVLCSRHFKGRRIGYNTMLREAVIMLHDLKFEQANYFPLLAQSLLLQCRRIVHDRYLAKTYLEAPEEKLNPSALEIRRNYSKLVALYDELAAISKARAPAEVQT
jgi:hypothetical protein